MKDQNEAKTCKVSASQVARGKEFGNIMINYGKIGKTKLERALRGQKMSLFWGGGGAARR